MSLKQLSDNRRINFLKLFTKELILNSIREELVKNTIESEKLKQKFIQPIISSEQAVKQIHNHAFQPSKYPLQDFEEPRQIFFKQPFRKPARRIRPFPSQPLKRPFLKKIKKQLRKQQAMTFPQEEKAQVLQTLQPQFQPKPRGFNLGKIEIFFKDPYIQLLECPGPGKNIFVKKGNQISPTRAILSQEEINSIINSFSENAKIPIVGGILKAAVGDLVISAVISEFVGSRFIINMIAPPLKPTNQR